MSVHIGGTVIKRVSVVEDDPESREGHGLTIEDAGAEPVPQADLREYTEVAQFLDALPASQADAVLCDYRLQQRNYAHFDGDQIVEACYKKDIPAVLCTSYSDWELTLMRSRRRFIPALLKVADLNPDSLIRGLERCIEEFSGQFQPSREASRTLVRVEDVNREAEEFHVVVPGWNTREKIRLLFDDLPRDLQPMLEPDKRFHAKVNIGCEIAAELFFFAWEKD